MFMVFLGTPFCGNRTTHENTSENYEEAMLQLKRIAYQIIAPTLIITGILGNILNLIVLGRPFLKGCTRIYLKALAIADLHVLIFEIPLVLRLNEIHGLSLHTAIYYAHFELVFVTTFVALSSFIVICLTVDRYISICIPLMFTKIHTKTKAKVALITSFITAIATSAPLFLMKHVCQITDECNDKWGFQDNRVVTDTSYWYVYLTTSELLIRIGPAIVLAILNILIIRKFRIITKRRNNFLIPSQQFHHDQRPTQYPAKSMNNRRARKYHEEKRLIILLQAVVVSFFLTMLPSSCLSFIYKDYHSNNLMFQIFRATANLLEIANSALNFCAYFLCSREFRKGLMSVLTGRPAVASNNKNFNCKIDQSNIKVISVQNDSTINVTNGDERMEVSVQSIT